MQALKSFIFSSDSPGCCSQSVQGGKNGSTPFNVQSGMRIGVFEGRVRDVQGFAFALLGATLARPRRRGVCAHGAALFWELPRGVRVHDGGVAGVGRSGLRLPLGAGGGQQRREGGRLEETFGSLRALEKETTGSDERLRVRGRAGFGKWLLWSRPQWLWVGQWASGPGQLYTAGDPRGKHQTRRHF